MKKGIDDLAVSKPYVPVDHKSLWEPMVNKLESDKVQIQNNIDSYEAMDKCKLPEFSMNDLGDKLNQSAKKLTQLSKLKPAPKKKEDQDKGKKEEQKDNNNKSKSDKKQEDSTKS